MAKLRRPAPRRLWTKEELEYLSDNYGLLPDDVLASRLHRPKGALKTVVSRKLKGLRHTTNFYTARMLSLVLGRKDPRTIALCIKRDWLKATKGPPGAGRRKMWNITEDNIITLLKARPWLADMSRMEEHYFRSIIRDEWQRDPWYGSKQVARRLGVKNRNTVLKYIYRGWLAAQKEPGGPEHRGWLIRESAIQTFLRNDPRKDYKAQIARAARLRSNLRLGIPTKLSSTWQIQCPYCGEPVTVNAPAWMLGRQVKRVLLTFHTNGGCTHGASCSIQSDSVNCSADNSSRMALAAIIQGR